MTEYFPVLSNGRILRGTLHVGSTNESVLIVHGFFSSNKIGPHRLYVEIANALTALGYFVLRIDLSGMGESDGHIGDFEFKNHVQDVIAISKKLIKYTNAKKIHYLGHCLGCCTVLKSAIINVSRVASLTMLSPFMPSKETIIELMGGQAHYNQLRTNGSTQRKGLVCKRSFISAGYLIYCYPRFCHRTSVRTMLYISADDEFVPLSKYIDWANLNKLKYKVIEEADHNYIDPSSRGYLVRELIKQYRKLRT